MIAFLSGKDTNNILEIIGINGENRVKLTGERDHHRNHRWSPSSDRVAYVQGYGHDSEILITDVLKQNHLKLSSIPGDQVGDWSKDSRQIIFSVIRKGNIGLYVRNPDGVNEKRLTETPDQNPVWSPNSKKIAFISTRDGNPEIYVMKDDGTDQTRFTSTETPEYDVSWSPDGRKLLYVSEENGNPEIYIADVRKQEKNRVALT